MSESNLGMRKIFRFWLPLAATWLMMSVEGPLLAALIARLADAKFNLAAYGVAFSVALVVEAPIIMIMSASTALIRGRESYLRLRNFTWVLNLAITLLMLFLLYPPVFRALTIDLVGLPIEVADLTQAALFILLPWPAAIGYRRLYQGVLIAANKTRYVAYGTILRLSGMSATGVVCFILDVPGACVGAFALSAGVILEAVASRIMVHRDLNRLTTQPPLHPETHLTYRSIGKFYYPLALTSILSLGIHPLITLMVGQSRLAVESLAVLPVVNSLVFIFRSFGLAYQEVGIAMIGDHLKNYAQLRNFAVVLMLVTTIGIGVIGFSPLHKFWFMTVSGLSGDLTHWAGLATQILVIMPTLSVLLSFQRAMAVNLRITRLVSWATALEVTGITTVLWFSIISWDAVGAVAAAVAMVCGRLCTNVFLAVPIYRRIRSGSIEGTRGVALST